MLSFYRYTILIYKNLKSVKSVSIIFSDLDSSFKVRNLPDSDSMELDSDSHHWVKVQTKVKHNRKSITQTPGLHFL